MRGVANNKGSAQSKGRGGGRGRAKQLKSLSAESKESPRKVMVYFYLEQALFCGTNRY